MGLGTTLKKLIGGVAPVLGSTLGGPLGGVAMKFIADKFTGGNTGDVEDFLLSANPEILAQLKMADKEFEKQMKELDIDLERIHAEDRQSARTMAVQTTLWPQIIIATGYLGGYFSVLGYLLYLTTQGTITEGPMLEMIKTLLAAFGVGVPIVLQFFFGSSAGSKEKTAAMANGKS